MANITDPSIKTVTSCADDDLFYNVDISDTTDSADGSDASITYANLQNQIRDKVTVANVAALQTLTGYSGGDVVFVKNYATAEDRGGGWFWLDATASLGAGAADSGLTFDSDLGTNWYWRRILEAARVTPQMWGAKGDGSTEDTTALNAAFDSLTNANDEVDELFIPKGTYITDGGLELSATDALVRGEGELKLKDSAGTGAGFGILRVSGSRNRVQGITVRGNTANPPSWDPGCCMFVDGNYNVIDNCKFYDARSTGTAGQQDNIRVNGVGNVVSNCYSSNAYNGLYYAGGNASQTQFKNCVGRRGSNTTKGFTASGGDGTTCNYLLLEGLDLDDVLQCDWAAEDSPSVIERLVISNCYVNTSQNVACKVAHARYCHIDNCHFETTKADAEGLTFAERIYDIVITNTYIRGGGGNVASSSHINSFGDAAYKHVNINNFTIENCIIGGTKHDPTTGTWDNNAIEVRAFKHRIINCEISQFANQALYLYPLQQGAINMTTSVATGTPSDNDCYILAAAPSGWGGSPSQYDIAIYNGTSWTLETPEYGMRMWDADTGDFYEFIDSTDGWRALSNDQYGIYVQRTTMTSYKNGTSYAVITTGSVGPAAYATGDNSRYFDNQTINLHSSGTFETTSNDTLRPGLLEPSESYTETSSGALYIRGSSLLDSSGGALTMTLGSGHYVGQFKTIVMTDATASSTVSVTNHETSDPEVFTFDAVDEYLTLVWTGTEWATVSGTATV